MSEAPPDESPVTWGELREVVRLTVTFCGELTTAAALSASGFDKQATDHMKVADRSGGQLNRLLGKEVVKGLSDE